MQKVTVEVVAAGAGHKSPLPWPPPLGPRGSVEGGEKAQRGAAMKIKLKPSDLQFKYPRDIENRSLPKFAGKPDKAPFDRDDLFEVLPMFAAVMDELGTNDGFVLHQIEETLNRMPWFIETREEVFDFLVECMRESMR
jgi:hypothetical protein